MLLCAGNYFMVEVLGWVEGSDVDMAYVEGVCLDLAAEPF